MGAFVIQLWLAKNAFSYILLFIEVAYWITMPFIYTHAKKLIKDIA